MPWIVHSPTANQSSIASRIGINQETKWKQVELADIVKTVVQWVNPLLPPGIRLTIHSSLEPGTKALCHRHSVLEALLNLVKNATEALVEGGIITIGLSQDESSGPHPRCQ